MRSLGTKNELMKGGEERERERRGVVVVVVEDMNEAGHKREEDMPRERDSLVKRKKE